MVLRKVGLGDVGQGGDDLVAVIHCGLAFGFELDHFVVEQANQQGCSLVAVDRQPALNPVGLESLGTGLEDDQLGGVLVAELAELFTFGYCRRGAACSASPVRPWRLTRCLMWLRIRRPESRGCNQRYWRVWASLV